MLQRFSWKLSQIFGGMSYEQLRSDWRRFRVKARLALTLIVIVPFLRSTVRLFDRAREGINQALVRWGVVQATRWIYCPRVLTVGERSFLFGAAFATLLFINLLVNGLFSYAVHNSWIFFTFVQFTFFSIPLLFTMRSIRLWVTSRGNERPDEQLFRKQLRRKHKPLLYYLRVTWFLFADELVKLGSVVFWVATFFLFLGLPVYFKWF